MFFIVWSWMCCAGTGNAYEQWKGRATAKVNVRKIPAGNGAIITQIKKGQKVTIRDKREGWYKIAIEEKTYGFMGWVYGKHIKKIPVECLETSSAIKKIRNALIPEESKTGGVFPAQPTKSPLINKTGKDEKPGIVPHKDMPAQDGATPLVKQEGMPSQCKVDRVAEQAHDTTSRKKGYMDKKEALTSSVEKDSVKEMPVQEPPSGKASNITGRPYSPPQKEPPKVAEGIHRESLGKGSVSGKRSNIALGEEIHEVGGFEKKIFLETEKKGTNDSKSKSVSGVLVGVVIKLLAAILSCFAIIFAFRARQLAIKSYDSTMKLQHIFQRSAPQSNP